jgi:hypothetical protein
VLTNFGVVVPAKYSGPCAGLFADHVLPAFQIDTDADDIERQSVLLQFVHGFDAAKEIHATACGDGENGISFSNIARDGVLRRK